MVSATFVSDPSASCLLCPRGGAEAGINLLTNVCCVQCSSTCAGGSQRRVVVCQDENGYTANDCVERIKPDEHRACESGPCPQWAYGSWGEVRANSTYTSFGKKQIPNSAVVHSLFEGRRTGSS